MFGYNKLHLDDNHISLSCLYFLITVLLFSSTSLADNSSAISRFTLQREKMSEAAQIASEEVDISKMEIRERGGIYKIEIIAIINAPIQSVRHVLTDFSHLNRLSPTITESEVVSQDNDETFSVRTRLKGCASYFCEELERVEKVQLLPSGDISAETIPEYGQFKSGKSEWKFKSLGEQCELTYTAAMKPDIYVPPVVSKFLVKKAIKEQAYTSIANLQKISSELCEVQDESVKKSSICN